MFRALKYTTHLLVCILTAIMLAGMAMATCSAPEISSCTLTASDPGQVSDITPHNGSNDNNTKPYVAGPTHSHPTNSMYNDLLMPINGSDGNGSSGGGNNNGNGSDDSGGNDGGGSNGNGTDDNDTLEVTGIVYLKPGESWWFASWQMMSPNGSNGNGSGGNNGGNNGNGSDDDNGTDNNPPVVSGVEYLAQNGIQEDYVWIKMQY